MIENDKKGNGEEQRNHHRTQRHAFFLMLLVFIGISCLLTSIKIENFKPYYQYGIVGDSTTLDSNRRINSTATAFSTFDRVDDNPHNKTQRRYYDRPPLSETFEVQPDFPRWGSRQEGINIRGIAAHLEDSIESGLYHFYIFGGHGGRGRGRGTNPHHPKIFVSNKRRRSYFGNFAFKTRLKPIERLLDDTMKYLVNNYRSGFISTSENGNVGPPKRWSRLWEFVRESSSPGIPLILQLGDIRSCNELNFRKNINGQTYSVPLFTVSARYHTYNCNHSFPIPSYSLVNMINQYQSRRQRQRARRGRGRRRTPKVSLSSLEPHQSDYIAAKTAYDWDEVFQKYETEYPWSNKNRQIVWRGSDTGGVPFDKILQSKITNKEDKVWSIRWKMVYQATQGREPSSPTGNDTMFDVGFHKVTHSVNDWQAFVHDNSSQFPMAKGMSQSDFQKYVGVLDVDGNAWSSRFVKLLTMNSVVLKVEPESVDYFQSRLEPWKHFVPIRMDSSNLRQVAEYVLDPKNDKEMQQIVHNAHLWVQENFQYEKLVVDMLDILEFYVQKLDNYASLQGRGNGNRLSSSSWTDQWDDILRDKNFLTREEIIPFSSAGWSHMRFSGWRGIPPCFIDSRYGQPTFACQV